MENENVASINPASTFEVEILIIDDTKSNLQLLDDILRNAGYKVRPADNGELAWRSIKAKLPTIILLDVRMPEMDGFELCRKLKADEATRSVPIIFISAIVDEPNKMMGFQVGGVDFISKPFLKEEVLARVKTHCDLRQTQLILQHQNKLLLDEIGKQKMTEKVLLDSEDRFKMLFEKAPLGYQSLDIDGNFIEVNETWLQILGYSKEEVIGQWFGDFLSPKYKEGFRERFPIFKALGKIHSKFEMVTKTGSIIFIAFDGRIGYTPAGEFKQTHCILNDITEKRRIENELISSQIQAEKSEAKFRFAVMAAPFPMMIHTEDGRVELVNDEWLKVTGYTREELSTTAKWTIRAYGIKEEIVREDIEKLYSITAKVDEGEYEVTTKSGEIRNWYFSSAPLGTNENGKRTVMSMALDFTATKMAQVHGRLSDEHFRTIFEQAPLGIALVNSLNGSLIEVNPMFASIVNRSQKELANIKWMSITHPDDIQQDIDLQNSLNAGEIDGFQMNKRYLKPDGSVVWINMRIARMLVEDKNHPCHLCMIEDITERKRTEEKLKESDDRLTFALKESNTGLWDWNMVDGSLNWSSGMFTLFGLDPDNSVASFEAWKLAMHPDDRNAATLRFEQAIRDKTPLNNDYRLIYPNGEIRWINALGKTTYAADEKPIRMAGICIDISESKLNEEKLISAKLKVEESEKEFRLLAEAMPQIVWITRADGWNVYFNQQWVDYTGLSLEESFGHGWNLPFHPDDQQRAWDDWQNAVFNHSTYSLECRLRRNDGIYRWWLIRGVPVLNDKGEILKWFGTCTDIDEIKQKDEELTETKSMLQAAFDNSQAGIAIAEAPSGKLIYVNQAALLIRGETKKEIVDNVDYEHYVSTWNILYLNGEPFKPEEVPLVRAVLFGEKSSSEFIVRRDNHEDRIVWANAAPILDDKGKAKFGIMVFLDITDRKLAEQKIEILNLDLENQVQQRTMQLNETIMELEEQTRVFVGRELTMIELKEKIIELENQILANIERRH